MATYRLEKKGLIKMKKYPNNTMMGELQQRLLQLRKFPLPAPIVKQKILDLEKMLTIADLQRKLQHQRFVLSHCPSMKECVAKTEAQLAAAVHLRPAPAVAHPAPGRDPAQEAAQDDGDRDEEASPQLGKAGHSPLGSPAQKVGELQTQVDGLQHRMEQLQFKVAELSKKRHVSRVSVQHLATSNCVPIQQIFREEILQDRVKLVDFVQSTFKKEEDEDSINDDKRYLGPEDAGKLNTLGAY